MTEMAAMRDAYGKALVELGASHPNVVVMDADLSCSTRTSLFANAFPHRFFNVGIAEQNLMGVAAGLALGGQVVFASSFAMFATGRAWEQIRNSIAAANLNVRIAATHAGITVGEDGSSHQALEDIALMRIIPRMKVFVPADALEAAAIIKKLVDIKGPCYIRMSRSSTPVVYSKDPIDFQPGKSDVLRKGKDITICACGIMVAAALEAAIELAAEGISAEVINVSSIKPLDAITIIDSAKKCGCVLTAEEHSIFGGLGSAIAECLISTYPVKLVMIGTRDEFGVSGVPEDLIKKFKLTPADVAIAARGLVRSQQKHDLTG